MFTYLSAGKYEDISMTYYLLERCIDCGGVAHNAMTFQPADSNLLKDGIKQIIYKICKECLAKAHDTNFVEVERKLLDKFF